jgi:drug/metabolite transporter (DMT)-like permease
VRKEFELATTEMTAKAKKAGAHVGVAAAGGALVHAGLLVLLAAIVIGLSEVVEPWLSALIVGVLTMVIGYVLVNRGLAGLRDTRMVPTQTIETLKEDARWTTRQGA